MAITRALAIINGLPRMDDITASQPSIYDEPLKAVSGAPANSNEITGPVTTGNNITLSNSGSYTGLELEVDFNGQDLVAIRDYTYVGAGTKTQIQLNFDLNIGDELHFRKTRNE